MECRTVQGGVFGLDPCSKSESAPYLHSDDIFFLNARSAILAVLKSVRPPVVWMPSYLCPSMLEPVRTTDARLAFYPIDRHLRIQEEQWLDEIRPRDLVVVLDYFGFCASDWICEAAKERGALVLEDASQALLSLQVGQKSDFVVFSPRKFIGIPDGGILRQKEPVVEEPQEAPPAAWWLKAFRACLLRRDYDLAPHDGDRAWFKLFQEAEAEMPLGNYQASSLSVATLKAGIDWDSVAQKRRDNYLFLLARLGDYALYPDLPPDVVPLGFPVCVPKRDHLRQSLFARRIFPPIHWDIGDSVPTDFAESHWLSRQIATLICDQRYGLQEMEFSVQSVLEALA